MKILNITNGSNTLDLMSSAGIAGDKISWDDVLHEGNVPQGLSLEALSKVRGDYIVAQRWASEAQVRDKFNLRDETLKNYRHYDQVVLWFEHDLYDQLQLIQILDWFEQQVSIETELALICVNQYLGRLSAAQIVALLADRKAITRAQLQLASRLWQAFTSNSEAPLQRILSEDLSALTYSKKAFERLLKEYPDKKSGLPLTEQLILQVLSHSSQSPIKLFAEYQAQEEAHFMADTIFFGRLNQMAYCDAPLIQFELDQPIGSPMNSQQTISISPYGLKTLAGKANWFVDSKLNKYIGGHYIE